MTDISLPAHVFFHVGPLPVTDGLLGALTVSFVILLAGFLSARKFAIIPNRVQTVFEMITEYLLGLLETAFGSREEAIRFFPLFMTMLIFIAVCNQITIVPFIFNITFNGIGVLRQPTSDLAQPLALSIMIFLVSNILALKVSPIKHISNFFPIGDVFKARSLRDLMQAGINMFVGFLNVFGEIAKVISLACRLFGNIFAGNVMLAVIISLSAFTQFIVPIPFIFLGIFSGFVQAFVFTLLSMQFTAAAIQGAMPAEPKKNPEELAMA